MFSGQHASRVEAIVRISHLPGPEDRFTFCALQISMPKARESHFKNQTAFSFHMQKRDEKCKLQLPWGGKLSRKTKNKQNQNTILCEVFLLQYFYFLFLIKLLRKLKIIRKAHLWGRSIWRTPYSAAHLPGKSLSLWAAERPQSSETAINCPLRLKLLASRKTNATVITKVNELDSSFGCQEDVVPLHISVDDSMEVQMLKALSGVPASPQDRERGREKLEPSANQSNSLIKVHMDHTSPRWSSHC